MIEDGIQRELGTITEMLRRMQQDNLNAIADRTNIQSSLNKLNNAVASLQEDMDVVKPVTDRVIQMQSIGLGVVLTIGFVATIVGITAATAWDWIVSQIGRN